MPGAQLAQFLDQPYPVKRPDLIKNYSGLQLQNRCLFGKSLDVCFDLKAEYRINSNTTPDNAPAK
jgi:hypothetical protein